LEFLLGLLPAEEAKEVISFVLAADRKRALASRVLQRACIARLYCDPFGTLCISRTRGRKPFAASMKNKPADAPNFNFNVSHEARA
jgi:4'-phosphopantetheinyl transferase